jgi:hypothetical protein
MTSSLEVEIENSTKDSNEDSDLKYRGFNEYDFKVKDDEITKEVIQQVSHRSKQSCCIQDPHALQCLFCSLSCLVICTTSILITFAICYTSYSLHSLENSERVRVAVSYGFAIGIPAAIAFMLFSAILFVLCCIVCNLFSSCCYNE